MKPVRVRFAPSPTGPLHIGGVRTALYNYLFAKKHNGTFILRIEDTDQTRYVEGAEDYIVESLKWCMINVDEGFSADEKYGPYKQSERKDIYAKYAKTLVETNNAYYAFDTPEELTELRRIAEESGGKFVYNYETRKQLRNSLTLSQQESNNLIDNNTPYVIRFNTPENVIIEMNDEIRGNIKVNSNTIDDKVLFKSDGLPTYHLANIVDDYLMQISHVIRGEEWLPSLPLHYMLYDAFGWSNDRPVFAHLPLILKPTGKGKLSKRDGDKMGFPVFPIEWIDKDNNVSKGYRDEGYLPDAFINMLALLGWNPGSDKEIFSINELIESFNLSKVHKAGARFDPDKAKWFNQKYLQRMNNEDIANIFEKVLESKGIKADITQIIKVIALVKDRIQFVNQIWDNAYFFFEAPKEFDQKVVKKRWKNNISEIMVEVLKIIEEENDFDSVNLKEKIAKFIEQNSYSFGGVMNSIRLSIVGGSTGPDLFSIVGVIGQDETVKRIKYAIETLPK